MVKGQSPAGGMERDDWLLARLRTGEEAVFAELIGVYGEAMLRIAAGVVSSSAVAEEVVQDTWLAVYTGVHRFEGRSSLRTWIFRILLNTAKTRRARDARTLSFSDLGRELSEDEPAVDPERFMSADQGFPGQWSTPPQPWLSDPESHLLTTEMLQVVRRVLDSLPMGQRTVVTLRDIQGWTPEEVSEVLGISRGNQRVLLHRARSRLRAALEEWMQVPSRSEAHRGHGSASSPPW